MAKTVVLFDDALTEGKRRLTLPDAVASAMVRAGIAAAADPGEAAALSTGGALSAATPTRVMLEHGLPGLTRLMRLTLPLAVALVAATEGVAAGVDAPLVSAAAAPGSAPTTSPVTPTLHYHVPSGSAITKSGSVITSLGDMRGFADATATAGTGPTEVTDGLGRKWARFEGSKLLNIVGSFVADQRSVTVFMVARQHKHRTATFFSLGNAANGTPVNTGGGVVNTSSSSNLPPYLRGSSISASSDATNKHKILIGSQVQVIGVASRPTASGGQRLYINTDTADVAQTTNNVIGAVGATIGSYAQSPGTTDWWEMAECLVFVGNLTNTQADSIAAAMKANWGISDVTSQLVMLGDSITDGVAPLTSAQSVSMLLTAPGAGYVPANCRLINMGVSGNLVSHLVAQRDATSTMFDNLLTGSNVVSIEIGRNNFGAGGQTGAQCYAEIVALLNTASTGMLQRGWTVKQIVNRAMAASVQTQNLALRALLRDPQFLVDCAAGPGGTYDGKLSIHDLPLITVAGDTKFDTATDAQDTTIYDSDATHMVLNGNVVAVSGGDTPQYGLGALV